MKVVQFQKHILLLHDQTILNSAASSVQHQISKIKLALKTCITSACLTQQLVLCSAIFLRNVSYILYTGSTGQNQFRNADGNSQAPDSTKPFGSPSNLGYSTLGNKQAMVEENPTYEMSIIQNNEAKHNEYDHTKPRCQEDPGYATPDFKRKEAELVNSYPEPGYESADLKRKEVNAAPSDSTHSMPDKNTGEGNSDVKRVEVNGELYALPDKKVRQFLNRRMLKEVASSNINDLI